MGIQISGMKKYARAIFLGLGVCLSTLVALWIDHSTGHNYFRGEITWQSMLARFGAAFVGVLLGYGAYILFTRLKKNNHQSQ